jgi:serine/threonine-protein kinase
MLLGEEYPLLFAGPGCSAADVQANWLGWHAHPGRHLTNLAQSLSHVSPAVLDILARMIRVDSFQQITRAGSQPREHVYQAPEQVRGIRDLTPNCDLYSLAAIVYEALTGYPPFPTNLKLPETIEAICHQSVAPPRSLDPSLPPEIDMFLLCALDKQAERRFQSAEEFEQAMRTVESKFPVMA